MTLPLVTLTGTGYLQTGEPAVGKTVMLTLQRKVRDDADDATVFPEKTVITLDDQGQIPDSTTVVPSDAFDPAPVSYKVREMFGRYSTYYVEIPTSDDPVDLFALAPLDVPTAPVASYATVEALEEEIARATAAEDIEATARADADTAVIATAAADATTKMASAQTAATAESEGYTDTQVAIEAATRAASDALLAPLASPGLTGTPTTPTASPGTNTTQVASTAFVAGAVAALIAAAPGALDTLDELAAAMGDDANFVTTVTNALALKAPLASPALTGNPTAPTASPGDSDTSIATTAFVQAALTALGLGSASTHAAGDFVGMPASVTDGFAVVYNSATDLFVTADRTSSGQELAYAANVTGVVTAQANVGVVDVPGVTISVPVSAKPVWLRASASIQPTTGPANPAFPTNILIYETTSGSTLVGFASFLIPQSLNDILTLSLQYRLGTTAGTRTFKLSVSNGWSGTINVVNTAAQPSWLTAETR